MRTGIPAVTKGFVAVQIIGPSSGATISTIKPGLAGSEITATTSPFVQHSRVQRIGLTSSLASPAFRTSSIESKWRPD